MANKIEVTIDVIIHATEDINKFFDAFEKIFGIESKKFSIQNLTGHFENPITLLNTKIIKKDADSFVGKFIEKITPREIERVIEDLDELVSSSGLHLRLDKQEFIKGNLILQENNAIKVKIYVPVYKKKETVKTYQTLLERSN